MRTEFVGTIDEAIEALRDPDTQTRVDAAWMLSEMGEEAAPALNALIQALHDNDSGVVAYVCDSLRTIGKNSEEAKRELRLITTSNNRAISGVAKETLIALESPEIYTKQIRMNRMACAIAMLVLFFLILALVVVVIKLIHL